MAVRKILEDNKGGHRIRGYNLSTKGNESKITYKLTYGV